MTFTLIQYLIMGKNLKINSLNVRGLRDKTKRLSIFSHLKKQSKGVTFLQETHSCCETEGLWRRDCNGAIYFAHGTTGARGVAILLLQTLQANANILEADTEGRYIIINATIYDKTYLLCNIYAPTKDHITEQLQFIERLEVVLSKYADQDIVLAGDFNFVLNPKLDKAGGKTETLSVYGKHIISLMDTFNLSDIWRIRNPDSKRFTHRQKTKCGIVHSRLDFFLISNNLSYNIIETIISTGLHTDHSLIEIVIKSEQYNIRVKGTWKMNTSLLKDVEYVQLVKQVISDTYKDNLHLEDKGLIWDFIKCKVRGSTISYSSYKAKERRKHENELLESIETYEKEKLDNDTYDIFLSLKKNMNKSNVWYIWWGTTMGFEPGSPAY